MRVDIRKFALRVNTATGFLVELGTGQRVLVTAAHVLTGEEGSPIVRWPGGTGVVNLLYEDAANDVAVLSDLPSMPPGGLRIASTEAEPDAEIRVLGFPGGWQGLNPLIARATLAGAEQETWLNFDGTWGHSGGPVFAGQDDEALVVGMVLRRAGDVKASLEAERQRIAQALEYLARTSAERDGVVNHLQAQLDAMPMGGLTEEQRNFHAVATLQAETVRGVGILSELLQSASARLLEFIDMHFRTGYVAMATAAQIRSALGL